MGISKIKSLYVILIIFVSFLIASPLYSQGGTLKPFEKETTSSSTTSNTAKDAVFEGLEYIGKQSGFNTKVTLIQIIGGVIRAVLGLVGILALIVIIVSGVQWTTAGGNEEKVMSARKTLLNAVIGLLVIVVSYSIVSFVMDKLITLGTVAPTPP